MKTFLVILAFIGIMDCLWLGVLSGNLYSNAIKAVQGSQMNFRVVPAIVAYALMALSLTVLFEKNVIDTPDDGLFWGAFMGLVIYGIFNGTNHAIFKGWDLRTSIYDTMWGVLLFAATAYSTTQIKPYLRRL